MYPRDFSHDLRQALRRSGNLDEALVSIRENGASIIESIKAVRMLRSCNIAEAKTLVQDSTAWADVKAQNDELIKELGRLSEDLDQ